MDDTNHNYRPITQVIDNLQRNHKLELIFEFNVGEGKLLVCTFWLLQIQDKPETAQLYQSMLKYIKSEVFEPSYHVDT